MSIVSLLTHALLDTRCRLVRQHLVLLFPGSLSELSPKKVFSHRVYKLLEPLFVPKEKRGEERVLPKVHRAPRENWSSIEHTPTGKVRVQTTLDCRGGLATQPEPEAVIPRQPRRRAVLNFSESGMITEVPSAGRRGRDLTGRARAYLTSQPETARDSEPETDTDNEKPWHQRERDARAGHRVARRYAKRAAEIERTLGAKVRKERRLGAELARQLGQRERFWMRQGPEAVHEFYQAIRAAKKDTREVSVES